MEKTNFSWKQYFLLKKITYPKKNNLSEIYFLVVKYRVFVKKKTLIRQKKPLSGNMTLPGKFFPIENFFHISCCLCAYFFIGYALWLCFSPSQRLFLGLGALLAPHQTLTSVPEREVEKKFSLRGFLGVRPSDASPDPRVGPLGGVNAGSCGGENAVK